MGWPGRAPALQDVKYLRGLRSTRSAPMSRKSVPSTVRSENLGSEVLVMQPAKQGVRHDASDLLNRARPRPRCCASPAPPMTAAKVCCTGGHIVYYRANT